MPLLIKGREHSLGEVQTTLGLLVVRIDFE